MCGKDTSNKSSSFYIKHKLLSLLGENKPVDKYSNEASNNKHAKTDHGYYENTISASCIKMLQNIKQWNFLISPNVSIVPRHGGCMKLVHSVVSTIGGESAFPTFVPKGKKSRIPILISFICFWVPKILNPNFCWRGESFFLSVSHLLAVWDQHTLHRRRLIIAKPCEYLYGATTK